MWIDKTADMLVRYLCYLCSFCSFCYLCSLPFNSSRLARWILTLAATRDALTAPQLNATGLPGGFLRSPLPGTRSPLPNSMPAACPVDSYVRCYQGPATRDALTARQLNATGLPGGYLRSPLPGTPSPPPNIMPAACPVDAYARCYPGRAHRLQVLAEAAQGIPGPLPAVVGNR